MTFKFCDREGVLEGDITLLQVGRLVFFWMSDYSSWNLRFMRFNLEDCWIDIVLGHLSISVFKKEWELA